MNFFLKLKSTRFLTCIKDAGPSFLNHNGLKLSAALSYYTVFSLCPVILMVIALCGLFYGEEAVQGKIFGQLNGFIGNAAAESIQNILKNVRLSDRSFFATLLGAIVLFIGATGVFMEIQESINLIWSLRAKPKKGLFKFFINRLLSFSMILSLGFLLLVSLIINTFMDLFLDRLKDAFQGMVEVFYVLNFGILFATITLLFTFIFKLLPDGHLKLKDTLVGAAFTAVLFMLGKLVISFYLAQLNIVNTYGSASSIILILLWVYYSSFILYFGAEFTKVYATRFGKGIRPKSYAILVEVKETTVMEG